MIAIVVFVVHCYMMYLFQREIEKFRGRLYWIYRTYFNGEERAGLDLPVGSPPGHWEVALGLILVSFVGFVFTAIYLWSVR